MRKSTTIQVGNFVLSHPFYLCPSCLHTLLENDKTSDKKPAPPKSQSSKVIRKQGCFKHKSKPQTRQVRPLFRSECRSSFDHLVVCCPFWPYTICDVMYTCFYRSWGKKIYRKKCSDIVVSELWKNSLNCL